MKIKVCGITTGAAAKAVAQEKSDFVGFVFAPSKRQVTKEQAGKLASLIPKETKKVGVFVNETEAKIIEIAEHVGLDYIQLHGDESVEFASRLPYPIIKAFSIDKTDLATIKNYPADYILIDSPGETYRGGSGKVFDWQRLLQLELDHSRLILAGGLNKENVLEAIQTVNPIAIDVSSGVETNGEKDPIKIAEFIQTIRMNI